jgi:hypothetical protein
MMKTLLAMLIGTAALIASSINTSHTQMGWGMMDGCREGYVYNAKRDVCIPTKKAKKVHRKKRGTNM